MLKKYLNSLMKLLCENDINENDVMEILINHDIEITIKEDHDCSIVVATGNTIIYKFDCMQFHCILRDRNIFQYICDVYRHFDKIVYRNDVTKNYQKLTNARLNLRIE